MRDALGRAVEDTEGMRSVSPIMPKVEGKYEVISCPLRRGQRTGRDPESAGGMEQILPHARRSPPDRTVWHDVEGALV